MQQKSKYRFPSFTSVSEKQIFQTLKSRSKNKQKQCKSGRLDRQTKLLLIVNGLFITASALSGTFVNVYLWKAKSDYSLIAWFTLIIHLTAILTFWLAGSWVKRYNKMNSLRLGVAVSAMFYTLILILGTLSVHYVVLLGIVQGMASGFFWLAFNVIYFELTERDNRDTFNGWAGFIGSGAGMIAPWISGYLITHMREATGYRLIFTISLTLFVIGAICSFFLKKRKAQGKYSWLFFYRSLRDNRHQWRWAGAALVAQGLREGMFAFIIGLLVYISTQSEMQLGNFSLITSAVGLFSFLVAGKVLKPHRRRSGMFVGAIMITVVITVFFWKVNFVTLLIFGITVSLFFPLYSIPMTSTTFDLIGKDEQSAADRVEYVVLRELALGSGRVLSVVIFLVVISWGTSPHIINGLMLGVGSAPILSWFFMRKLLPYKEMKT